MLKNKALSSILENFKQSPYELKVQDNFVRQFFRDRRLITGEVRRSFNKRNKNLLKDANHAMHMSGTHLFGQTTLEENFVLGRIVEILRPKKVLEIGIFRGQTALTLTRALSRVKTKTEYVGIDIDEEALNIAQQALKKAKLLEKARLILGNSNEYIKDLPGFDFAYVDGDHSYPAVTKDVVEVYNKMKKGGVIAINDIGSIAWGSQLQDPGHLFFRVLPKILGKRAYFSWLDPLCRQTTMQLLSPGNKTRFKYADSLQESLEIAKITLSDVLEGWGGLGFIVKLDFQHKLDYQQLLKRKPGVTKTRLMREKQMSMIGKAVRKIANLVP